MGIPEPSFFEVGYIGLPAGIIGIIYLIIFAPIILPKSGGMFKDMMKKDRLNLITEARVTETFSMLGKPVSELLAKLGLPTETVIKIRRRNFDDSSTPAALNADPFLEIYPVLPTEPIMAGDIVFLSGEGNTEPAFPARDRNDDSSSHLPFSLSPCLSLPPQGAPTQWSNYTLTRVRRASSRSWVTHLSSWELTRSSTLLR